MGLISKTTIVKKQISFSQATMASWLFKSYEVEIYAHLFYKQGIA